MNVRDILRSMLELNAWERTIVYVHMEQQMYRVARLLTGDLPVHRQGHEGEVRFCVGQRAITSLAGHPVQELRHGRTRGGE